jgi:streptogrisin D
VRARYGDRVELFVDDIIAIPADRHNDSQPWNGGNVLTNGGQGRTCSQGPSVRNPSSGNKYALIAAHCGVVGSVWTNTTPFAPANPARIVGSINYRDFSQNGSDSALIAANTSNLIWTVSNVRQRQVSSAPLGQPINDQVCVSGAISGEGCSATIVASNICTIADSSTGRSACNVTVAQRTGYALAGGGDSGGPVYKYVAGGLNVLGIISFGAGGSHVLRCNHYPERRTCSDKVGYIEIQAVLNEFGAVLNT